MSMMTIKIGQLLEKVRTLSKQCNLPSLPSRIPQDQSGLQFVLDEYLRSLDELRVRFYEYHEISQEYRKLEEALQRSQTEIRRHIGIQQQLKLYIDTLKSQYEQSETDRLSLLQNSKSTIRDLKAENQKLFGKIRELENNPHRSKASSKKIPAHERSCTDQVMPLYTEPDAVASSKKKKNISDFKVQLTDRPDGMKRKMFDARKKGLPGHTVMAYSSCQKKGNSREKNSGKKHTQFSDTKKIGATSGFKFNQQRSNKKVNRSVFSLPDCEPSEGKGEEAEIRQDGKNEAVSPNAFYFSPDILRRR